MKNINKIELKNTQTREYLDKRFEEFLEKEGINKKDLTETALKVFRKGYKYVFVSTLPDRGDVL